MIGKIALFGLPLFCSLLSAGTVVVVKAINGSMDSVALGFVRLVLTAVSLLPIVLIKKDYPRIARRDFGWLFLIGLVGYCLNTELYLLALLHAPALNVALINVLIPVLTLFFCFVFFRDTPSRYEIAAFFIAFIGVVFVITEGQFDVGALIDSYGEFLALSSSTCWVLYTIMLWHLRGRYSPYFITCAGSAIGATCMIPFVWWSGGMLRTFYVLDDYWLAVAYIGLIGTSVLYVLYIKSVELIGPSLTAFIMYSTRPAIVAILAYLVLGSQVSWWQFVGGLFIVGALALVTYTQQVGISVRS